MSNYDPTDLPGQQADKREADKRKKLDRDMQNADVKWLMSSPRGRRVMWRLLELSGPFRISFDTNAMRMAFNEGNRNLGNLLLTEVMILCPELYPVMVKEQKNDRDGKGDQSN
jgi:hypothetical protein